MSRGLLSSLMEPKQVLAVINSENSRTPHRIIINTYAVVDGKSSVSLLLLCSAYLPHVVFLVHGQVTIIFVVSVCLFVCLFVCAEFLSAVFDPISVKLGTCYMYGSSCVP